MKDLIEALTILNSWDSNALPCYENRCLYVYGTFNFEQITPTDKERLEFLGFEWNADLECYTSDYWGSF